MADIKKIKVNGTDYNVRDDSKVLKSGDTMTGDLELNGNKLFVNSSDTYSYINGSNGWVNIYSTVSAVKMGGYQAYVETTTAGVSAKALGGDINLITNEGGVTPGKAYYNGNEIATKNIFKTINGETLLTDDLIFDGTARWYHIHVPAHTTFPVLTSTGHVAIDYTEYKSIVTDIPLTSANSTSSWFGYHNGWYGPGYYAGFNITPITSMSGNFYNLQDASYDFDADIKCIGINIPAELKQFFSAVSDIDLSSKYLSTSGGTVSGDLKVNNINLYSGDGSSAIAGGIVMKTGTIVSTTYSQNAITANSSGIYPFEIKTTYNNIKLKDYEGITLKAQSASGINRYYILPRDATTSNTESTADILATRAWVSDQLPDTSDFIKKDGSVAMTGDLKFNTGYNIIAGEDHSSGGDFTISAKHTPTSSEHSIVLSKLGIDSGIKFIQKTNNSLYGQGYHQLPVNDGSTNSNYYTLATREWVNSQGFLTSHQDISGKLNKSGDTMSGNLYFDPGKTLTLYGSSNVNLVLGGYSNQYGSFISYSGPNNLTISASMGDVVINNTTIPQSATLATQPWVQSNQKYTITVSSGVMTVKENY